MRTRKNVKILTAAERSNLAQAMLELRNEPGILHPSREGYSRYDDYVEVHRDAASSGWAQGGPAFLPWHREFLLQFENDLSRILPGVTLPYWDWTDTTVIEADEPFRGDYPRDSGSDPTAPSLPTMGLQNAILSIPAYSASPWQGVTNSFRWQCETALHNLTRRHLAGGMHSAAAPDDPLFFLHAANVDRLWAMWQDLHPASAHYLPVAGAAPGHNLDDQMIFRTSGPAPFDTCATPASVMHHHALGYQYDTEAHAPPRAGFQLPPHLQVLQGAGEHWNQLSPGVRNKLIGLSIDELKSSLTNTAVRRASA